MKYKKIKKKNNKQTEEARQTYHQHKTETSTGKKVTSNSNIKTSKLTTIRIHEHKSQQIAPFRT